MSLPELCKFVAIWLDTLVVTDLFHQALKLIDRQRWVDHVRLAELP